MMKMRKVKIQMGEGREEWNWMDKGILGFTLSGSVQANLEISQRCGLSTYGSTR